MKALAPVGRAADKPKAALRDAPFAGEQGDDGCIGLAVLGCSANRNPQRHAAIGLWTQSFDGVAPGAGMCLDTDTNPVGCKAERRGINERRIQTADCG